MPIAVARKKKRVTQAVSVRLGPLQLTALIHRRAIRRLLFIAFTLKARAGRKHLVRRDSVE
jgi:hypothetical protein